MKIFISHSSQNSNYGNALVDLLTGIGIKSSDIIFTSNTAYGIPIGQNIFDWLKSRITEKSYVLYLLSPEYYKSVPCLNEMGAAWVIENDHAMIFTPNFDLKSSEFLNGALDPRKIGFYINDKNRLISFIETLSKTFNTEANFVLINQKIEYFLKLVDTFSKSEVIHNLEIHAATESIGSIKKVENRTIIEKATIQKPDIQITVNQSRFYLDLTNDKLKDEEILLLRYIIENDKYKLKAGWQESIETDNIKVWEDIHELNNTLSRNYGMVLKRFEMKNLTEISELTSQNNAKEFRLKDKFKNELINNNDVILAKIKEVSERNKFETPNIDW